VEISFFLVLLFNYREFTFIHFNISFVHHDACKIQTKRRQRQSAYGFFSLVYSKSVHRQRREINQIIKFFFFLLFYTRSSSVHFILLQAVVVLNSSINFALYARDCYSYFFFTTNKNILKKILGIIVILSLIMLFIIV
jgi:hypothetical protein